MQNKLGGIWDHFSCLQDPPTPEKVKKKDKMKVVFHWVGSEQSHPAPWRSFEYIATIIICGETNKYAVKFMVWYGSFKKAKKKKRKKKWVFWVRKTNVFSIMKEFWVHCWYHTRRKTKQNKTKMEQNSWFGWLENQKRTDFFGVGKTAIF